MEKILVSACLAGEKTRYDGKSSYIPLFKELQKKYDIILVCPEVFGGLSTPRPRSEIKNGKVINEKGFDVTKKFESGVDKAITAVKYFNITKALLKDGSPSCGSSKIHDGSFTSAMISGQGLLAERLTKIGVEIYTEDQIESLL
ncbi:MAG: DUF523 domain-containing protein [Bacilli bacterium]